MAYYQLKPNAKIGFAATTLNGGDIIETDKDLIAEYGAHMVEVLPKLPVKTKAVKLPTAADYAALRKGFADRRTLAIKAAAAAKEAAKAEQTDAEKEAAEQARIEAEEAEKQRLADEEAEKARLEAEAAEQAKTKSKK